jgi:putative MATE family efflux protein
LNLALFRERREKLLNFYRDREYFARLFSTALPIALQNLVMSSLNLVSVMMIGQLGEVSVAAVGLSNQVYFLLTLYLFGITSGSAIFTAQLWGKGDVPNIRRVLGLALKLAMAGGTAFFLLSVLLPSFVLGIYSQDPQVIRLGSDYLRVFGWSFLFLPVTFCFSAVLRSTGDVRLPLFVSGTALTFNALLSFLLIFGIGGLPRLGILGAAVSVLITRVLEALVLVGITLYRRLPAAVSLVDILNFDLAFAARILKPIAPVAVNEVLWALGVTSYNIVYARISTESIAAMNIASSIDNLAIVAFNGIAHACAVLVGNRIGAGEETKAFQYAGRSLGLGALGGLFVGSLILLGVEPLLGMYKVSAAVIDYTQRVLVIISLLLWLRASNLILFVGIFRSGGDTRFALLLDAGIIWAIGVPLAVAGAFLFHLPVYLVYLLVMTEELTKWLLGMRRFLSRKWIHNLAQTL